MNTSSEAPEQGIPLANTPLMYADTLVGLAIGPFVSKIILGVENPGQQNLPSLQISMPTNALHDLARHIFEVLQNQEAQKNISKGHSDFQEAVAASAKK